MKWRLASLLILLLLTTYFLLPTSITSAATPTELEQQINQNKENLKQLEREREILSAELEAVNREAQSLGTAVKSLDTTRKKLAADINVTQSKITSTDLTIKSLENTMGEKERQIVTHRQAIAETITALSEYDSKPLLYHLLAYVRLSDIWQDNSQLAGLSGRLEEEIDALRETKKILNQQKEQKEKVKGEQVSLKGQLSGQKSVVEENKKAKEKLLAETKNKEAEYQKLLVQNMARQKQSEQDLSNLEQQLRITLDPTLFPSPNHGILSWPLDQVYITGTFGKSDCKIYPPPDCFHNGLDFRASMGTPVRAMFGGVVSGTDNTDSQKGCYSYGRWILLKYDNGLSSVYAHLSAAIVKNDQRVRAGEIVGYSGGTPGVYGSGYSKGQHLHVGLFATQGVEVRQFTTSIGCKQVSVPIALGISSYLDPLAYLPAIAL